MPHRCDPRYQYCTRVGKNVRVCRSEADCRREYDCTKPNCGKTAEVVNVIEKFFRAYRRCEAVFVMTHGRFAANLPIVWALSRLVLLD